MAEALGPVTNGANMIKQLPHLLQLQYHQRGRQGGACICPPLCPSWSPSCASPSSCCSINSSYGRAFKAIREDEIAAEAMGINLAKHKMLSFCISSFFAGVGGALFAMFANNAQAKACTPPP